MSGCECFPVLLLLFEQAFQYISRKARFGGFCVFSFIHLLQELQKAKESEIFRALPLPREQIRRLRADASQNFAFFRFMSACGYNKSI